MNLPSKEEVIEGLKQARKWFGTDHSDYVYITNAINFIEAKPKEVGVEEIEDIINENIGIQNDDAYGPTLVDMDKTAQAIHNRLYGKEGKE